MRIIKKSFNLMQIYFPILLEKFSIYLKFLSFKCRILSIRKFTILEFDDTQIKKIKLANNFEDLIFKIFTLIKRSKLNLKLLEKFLFLINYSSKRKFYLDFAEKYIKKYDFNFKKLPNLFPYIIGPFALAGDYRTVDKLIFILRNKKDKFYKREIGLYDERSYLTAIGHLWLFCHYLKAKEINYLGQDKSSFLFNKDKIANSLLFQLIKAKAESLEVSIVETNKRYEYFNQEDHEIELLPLKQQNKYISSSKTRYFIWNEWEKFYQNDNFLKVSDQIFSKAKEILKANNILNSGKWFIGIHLRNTSDNRLLRNSSIENIFTVCDVIKERGGEIIFTGTDNFMDLNRNKNITFINELNLSKSENELLQLYTWKKASFFVGNLSGGTHPPSLFGTPTIFIDAHPSSHASSRSPSKLDTVIPKTIYDLVNKRFLTLNESNSVQHFKCQTESEFLAQFSGYRIFPSDKKIIKQALEFYISKYVFKEKSLINKYFKHDKILSIEDIQKLNL